MEFLEWGGVGALLVDILRMWRFVGSSSLLCIEWIYGFFIMVAILIFC